MGWEKIVRLRALARGGKDAIVTMIFDTRWPAFRQGRCLKPWLLPGEVL